MLARRDVFQAIADPVRREMLLLLAKEQQNVNALAAQFRITRQGVSLHLKILEECGLVTIQQEGRNRMVALKQEELGPVKQYMDQLESVWRSRFNALDGLLAQLQTPAD